jgi:hypothetical protein
MLPRIEQLFAEVMAAEGYEGWTLRWLEHDAYCWIDQKRIDLCPMDSEAECAQMLLHEVAHISTAAGHRNKHHPGFFARLEELTQKYLGVGLSQYQLEMKQIYCPD